MMGKVLYPESKCEHRFVRMPGKPTLHLGPDREPHEMVTCTECGFNVATPLTDRVVPMAESPSMAQLLGPPVP